MTSKKIQKAGNKSQLIQADTLVLGLDEKRVREVVDEKLNIALASFTSEALGVAKERSRKMNENMIERMIEEKALHAFSDPSFQILLIEAQKSAASSERESDYGLLSELMVHRFKKDSSRNARAGITRAVEIVDQVSDDALLGVTIFHSVSYFAPKTGNLNKGLEVLENLFGNLIYSDLPLGIDWIDHLDILDAIRVSSIGSLKSLEEYWLESFDGYSMKGIERESDNHTKAKDLLKSGNLNENLLVENQFDDKYLKIEVLNKDSISKMQMSDANHKSRSITDIEKDILENIYDLYDGKKIAKEDFVSEIEKYPNLKKVRDWWNSLKNQSIRITSVGKVLAHSNAQRIDNTLPPLN